MGQSVSKTLKDGGEKSDIFGRREVGIIIIIAYHRLVQKLLQEYNVKVPPVLVSLIGVLGGLNLLQQVTGKDVADAVIQYLDPAADWLGFWMPLWLTPPLVVLPNALLSVKGADGKTWVKLAIVHFVSWCLTVLGSAKLFSLLKSFTSDAVETTTLPSSDADSSQKPSPSISENSTSSNQLKVKVIDKKIKLLKFWGSVAVAFYGFSLAKMCDTAPALATTSITAMCVGDLMSPAFKKTIHPVIFTAVVSAVATLVLHRVRGDPGSWEDALRGYFANGKPVVGHEPGTVTAGDVFFSFLGPCCVGLALRIHTFLQLSEMQRALPAVLGTSACITVASLLGSPLLARLVGLPSELAAVLSHRSITTSLAVPSAQSLGASPELTVAAVLISGLYGTSSDGIRTSLGITDDHVASGVTLGMASHSLGTASLISLSRTATASASLTMFAAGMFHAIACSVPAVRQLAILAAGAGAAELY